MLLGESRGGLPEVRSAVPIEVERDHPAQALRGDLGGRVVDVGTLDGDWAKEELRCPGFIAGNRRLA